MITRGHSQSLSSTVPMQGMQGYLGKANFFNRYQKKYYRLEGEVLAYGKSKKKINKGIDLREAYVEIQQESQTRFKIITPKDKFKLKAYTKDERDKWMGALEKIT